MNKQANLQVQFFSLINKAKQHIAAHEAQAEQYAKDALKLAEDNHNKQWQAEALYQLATYYSKIVSQFKQSNELCEQALALIADIPQNVLLFTRLLRLLGLNEHFLGRWQNAQEHYQEAIKLLEAQTQPNEETEEELAFLYYYSSVLNQSSETKDGSIQFLNKAIAIFERLNNKGGLARCYNTLASYLNEKKAHEKALENQLKALALFEEQNEVFFAAVVRNNAGYTYCELGNFEKGFEMLNQSLQTKLKYENPSALATSYIHLGLASKLQKNWTEAIKYFHEGENILKELDSKSDLNTVYSYLSETYALNNDYKRGYEYHVLYDQTKDEMFNFNKAAAIMDAKSKFELDKRKKEAKMLTQKNSEIENYVHQLEISNNELKQFAYVASHDLKEPLHMINNYIQLLEKEIKQKEVSEEVKTYMEFVNEGSKRMFTLINSLLEFSRLNSEIHIEKIDLNNIITEIRNQHAQTLENVSVSIDNMPEIFADQSHIYRLFEHLINNAIKFNLSTKKIIDIKYNDTDRTHEFRVIDNGIGISKEYAEKVFVIFQRLNARGQFLGTGIGLAICKKIVDNLKGKIWVEQNNYGGSTFCISIPK